MTRFVCDGCAELGCSPCVLKFKPNADCENVPFLCPFCPDTEPRWRRKK